MDMGQCLAVFSLGTIFGFFLGYWFSRRWVRSLYSVPGMIGGIYKNGDRVDVLDKFLIGKRQHIAVRDPTGEYYRRILDVHGLDVEGQDDIKIGSYTYEYTEDDFARSEKIIPIRVPLTSMT